MCRRRWRRCAAQTYADYAWPPALGALYRRNGLTLSLALAGGAGAVPGPGAGHNGTLWRAPGRQLLQGVPHNLLVGLFAPVFGFAVLALALGVRRLLARGVASRRGAPLGGPAAAEAAG